MLPIGYSPYSFYTFETQQTKKIVESDLPFIVMSVMYIYLLALSWTPETAGCMFASKYLLPEASRFYAFLCIGINI